MKSQRIPDVAFALRPSLDLAPVLDEITSAMLTYLEFNVTKRTVTAKF
jgi:hypothetical protein